MADGILGDVGINVHAEGFVGNHTSATSSATYTPSLTSGAVPPAATSSANERDGASMYFAGEAFAATPAAAVTTLLVLLISFFFYFDSVLNQFSSFFSLF